MEFEWINEEFVHKVFYQDLSFPSASSIREGAYVDLAMMVARV